MALCPFEALIDVLVDMYIYEEEIRRDDLFPSDRVVRTFASRVAEEARLARLGAHHLSASPDRTLRELSRLLEHYPRVLEICTRLRPSKGDECFLEKYGRKWQRVWVRLQELSDYWAGTYGPQPQTTVGRRKREDIKRPRKKPGRKRKDPELTDQLYDAWETGHYREFKDLVREFGRTEKYVEQAVRRKRRALARALSNMTTTAK